jgi:hypothetical protein
MFLLVIIKFANRIGTKECNMYYLIKPVDVLKVAQLCGVNCIQHCDAEIDCLIWELVR